jgi:anti-anti-sigma regulatory factor
MPPVDPLVMTVTTALNKSTAEGLARRVDALPVTRPVVIDLTGIPAFDSEGADVLLELQATRQDRQVAIVGLRQATSRLVAPPADAPPVEQPGWEVRRLRNLAVVQPTVADVAAAAGLDAALGGTADDPSTAIIVVDLRGVAELTPEAVQSIAFASSAAALRGQELLVVNVTAGVSERLRAQGLSATTYLAPETIPGLS